MNLIRSTIFVVVQFACLGLIAVSGPLIPTNLILFLIELAGIGLGVWAVLAMGAGNVNIAPDPLAHARLVTSGPYRLIRHPMYMALLITCLPLLIHFFTPLRLAIYLLLLVDLLFKLHYEEGLLAARFEGYVAYQGRSHKLIPFIY
jgi:protein-S-isoprenylcysteine O-methyltransferase Ste14